jgi:hypothetical protein
MNRTLEIKPAGAFDAAASHGGGHHCHGHEA